MADRQDTIDYSKGKENDTLQPFSVHSVCQYCNCSPCIFLYFCDECFTFSGYPISKNRFNEFPEKMKKRNAICKKWAYVFFYCEYYGKNGDELEEGEVTPNKLPVCVVSKLRHLFFTSA